MNLKDFFEIVDNRKTNRKYQDYTPPIDDIKRIIESARLAPSAVNAQNWKFIAVYKQQVKEDMAQEVLKLYDRVLEADLDAQVKEKIERYKSHSTFFTKAPVVIAIVQTKCESFFEGILEKVGFPQNEIALMRPDSQLLSMGGAIENMALSAKALGLGSCWMVAPVLAQEGLKKVLNIKAEDKLVSLLTIGKPEDNDKRSPKKTLEEVFEIII